MTTTTYLPPTTTAEVVVRPWAKANKPTRNLAPARRTQTTRIGGKRVKLTTNSRGKVTVAAALPLEWDLQAAQVRRLRAMPEHGKRFLLAGDQNAAKRGPKARGQALAAGMTAGEPDVRIYLQDGRIKFIENKVGREPLLPSQVKRHADLTALGHEVVVVWASTEDSAADQAAAIVRGWLKQPAPLQTGADLSF